MLTEERHSMIIKAVNERASVTIAELSEILNVSASTVKRDLIILANEGKIIKVRGGAMSKNDSFSSVEKNVEEKSAICTEEKNSIAGYAAKLIEKGDFVFLDAGTTTEKMIDHLTVRDVTFVTNGFIHAKKLAGTHDIINRRVECYRIYHCPTSVMSAASLYFLLGILSVIMTAFPSPANVAELTSSNFEWSAKT